MHILLATSLLPSIPVTFAVTADAKRNQVVYNIVTKPAPRFHVRDLQAFHGTALLTLPTISLQDASSEFRVFFRAQFKPGLLLTKACGIYSTSLGLFHCCDSPNLAPA